MFLLKTLVPHVLWSGYAVFHDELGPDYLHKMDKGAVELAHSWFVFYFCTVRNKT